MRLKDLSVEILNREVRMKVITDGKGKARRDNAGWMDGVGGGGICVSSCCDPTSD
jgi:hypothetical protein